MEFAGGYLFHKKPEDMRGVGAFVVVLAHGIFDSTRPVKCLLLVRSAGLARKPLARLSATNSTVQRSAY